MTAWADGGLHDPLVSIVTSLLQDEEAQANAASQLANLIDNAEGEYAEAVGQTIRDFGAMDTLLDLLERPATQQDALRVIGNLASNAVDSKAEETKKLLHDLGAFPRVLPLIHSATPATVVYALGAVQNMLTRPEYAAHMRDAKADVRLNEILSTAGDDTLRHFAKGCLANMKAVSQANFKVKEVAAERAAELPPPPSAGGEASAAGTSALVRYRVAADNSCLFTTCALLCDSNLGAQPSPAQLAASARGLRASCAKLVRDSPKDGSDTLALLGFEDSDAYARWITDETRWGGEPEVSMLSEIFK